jgi:dihydroceramidase
MTFRVRFPYGQPQPGYWGDQTSTIDWCEENYTITPYCAEPVNTLTNLAFMYLGYKGIRNCVETGLSPIIALAYVGYIVVGLGSMAFHTSLWCW